MFMCVCTPQSAQYDAHSKSIDEALRARDVVLAAEFRESRAVRQMRSNEAHAQVQAYNHDDDEDDEDL